MDRRLIPIALTALLAAGSTAGCGFPGPSLPPVTTAAADPAPTPTTTTAPPIEWGSMFYYPESSTTATAPLMAWRPGEAQTRALLTLDSYAALYTAAISVDGARIAYATGRPDAGSRALVVANVDGTGQRQLQASVLAECAATWSPDGTRLAMVKLSGEEAAPGFVDVATGEFSVGIVDWTCHKAWSGDGRSMVNAGGGGELRVTRSDVDGGSTRVPGLGESTQGGRMALDVMSVSADGRLAAVFVAYAQPTETLRRQVRANEIVDTTTGAAVQLPVPGELVQAYFRPHGGAVLRIKDGIGHALVLVSADLRVLDRVVEPAALAGSILLGHGVH